MIRQVLAAFAILSAHLVFSQTRLLSGKVIDIDNNEPIPYASIALIGTNAGTACNENGKFDLAITDHNLKIYISSIGYLSKAYSADSLLALKDVVLPIRSDKKLLDEIVVTSNMAKPTEILQEALNNVPKNYYTQEFNLEAYSTLKNYDSTNKTGYTLETILLGYYDGYKPNGFKKFKILEKRESGSNPLKSYKYWPSFELYSVDLITDHFAKGIFNPEHWDKFKFKQQDITLYDKDTVFVIEYDLPKPTEKVTGYGNPPKYYKGKVYIALNNYAIVRHTLMSSTFDMDIIYKKIGTYYFPYLIKGTRTNEFKLDGKRKSVQNTNTIIVNNIVLTAPKKIEPKENEWDPSIVKFNESYWSTSHQ